MSPFHFPWGISRPVRGLFLALALLAASSPVWAAAPTPGDTLRIKPAVNGAPYSLEPYPYRIAPGDQLFVDYGVFLEGNQVTARVLVRPDGMVSLPYVGEVLASDRSTAELDSVLAGLYSKVYVNARITTSVTEVAGNLVHVLGQVTNPGSYPMLPNSTALQAIAQAGGFEKDAARGDVLVIRRAGPTAVGVKKLNLKELLSKHNMAADVMLRRADIVYVNRSMIGDINLILDQVLKPVQSIGDTYTKAWTIVNIDRVFPPTIQSGLRP